LLLRRAGPVRFRASLEQWAALELLALTDRLTALSNRHAGERALERKLARARRTKAAFSLAVMDIDRFKLVNDHFGHAAGDEVLRRVSRVLTPSFVRRIWLSDGAATSSSYCYRRHSQRRGSICRTRRKGKSKRSRFQASAQSLFRQAWFRCVRTKMTHDRAPRGCSAV
jgi:hypothetical protein